MNTIRQLILDTTTKICQEHATSAHLNAIAAGQWPEALWNTLVDAGLPFGSVSEELGGAGLSLSDAYAPLQVLGKFATPLLLAESLVAGQLLSNAGVQFPSKMPVSLTCVTPNKLLRFNGSALTGEIQNIPYGRHAKTLMVVLNETDQSRYLLISDIDKAEGVQIEPAFNMAGEPSDRLIFTSAVAVQEIAVRPLNEAETLLALTRVLLMTGALESVLEMSVQYALERKQFGKPIGKFQAIQQQLAVAAGEVAASVRATDALLAAIDSPLLSTEVAIAKARVGEAAGVVAEIGHQVHGAIGFTYEHALHYRTRRLWVWRDDMGNETDWQLRLGLALIESGADALWDFIVYPKPI